MQKKLSHTFFTCCLFLIAYIDTKAQNIASFVDSILQFKTIKIPEYQFKQASYDTKFYEMEFCGSKFIDTTGLYLLQNAEILSVNLIFTDYPSTLDLKPLNRSRFIQLNKYLPNAMYNNNTQWLVIRQMNGATKETAKKLKHGFVINYRLPVNVKDKKAEINYLRNVIPDPPEEEEQTIEPVPTTTKKVNHWAAIRNGGVIQYNLLYNRNIKKISSAKKPIDDAFEKNDSIVTLAVKDAIKLKIISGKEKGLNDKSDSVYVLLEALPEVKEYLPKRPKTPVVIHQDKTIEQVFERNKFKQMLLVADVTSSMYRYNAQIIQWLKDSNNTNNMLAIVCFNDGDNKTTEQKEIGNTGGIYAYNFTGNLTALGYFIDDVMQKGSGGDLQENNCEALIKAIEWYPQAKEVVMIADSWSPVRDINLIHQINKPIKIIICGNDLGPHPDYVTIAYKTKGSLHFNDADVSDFTQLENGRIMNIKGTNYILKNDRVVYAR
jgi:hypothetical protein